MSCITVESQVQTCIMKLSGHKRSREGARLFKAKLRGSAILRLNSIRSDCAKERAVSLSSGERQALIGERGCAIRYLLAASGSYPYEE
jgi:hypothetical protein